MTIDTRFSWEVVSHTKYMSNFKINLPVFLFYRIFSYYDRIFASRKEKNRHL